MHPPAGTASIEPPSTPTPGQLSGRQADQPPTHVDVTGAKSAILRALNKLTMPFNVQTT